MIAREPAFGSSVDWFIGFCVAASSISGAFGGPAWFSIAALAGAGVGAWLRPNDTLVLWYVATLPFIVPQDAMAIRLSIADLFMIPVIVRCAAAAIRGEWRPERSTVVGVLATLVIAFGVATVIGYVRVGRLTPYALVNKDAGLLFQVATYVALLSYAARKVDVLRLARWFVAGVSIANLTALAGIVASRFDVDSALYVVDNGRFYGWVEQPTINGGLMMTAALIEFGLLRTTRGGRLFEAARWVNLWLLGFGILATISRGSWLGVACGSAMFLALLWLFDRDSSGIRPRSVTATALVWFLVPTVLLANILRINVNLDLFQSPVDRSEEIRCLAIAQCIANPSLPTCPEVRASQNGALAPCPEKPQRRSSRRRAMADDDAAYGPMMNARGVNDRFAILYLAWQSYVADPWSIALGTGLGTFFVTSARDFGVPIIIHSTYEWFLVELGPLGFVTLVFVWWRTARNLRVACADANGPRYLAMGLFAAFAALAVFCVTNEGFYQRQLWLVMLFADRLAALSTSAPAPAPAQAA